jgi:hypothetical protein
LHRWLSPLHLCRAPVITKEFAAAFAQDVYVWGWPIVNAFHRRTSFASEPEPGLNGGILPVAPVGYVSMLLDYIVPEQRWVAHPNQDVVYGFGFGAVDKEPLVVQVRISVIASGSMRPMTRVAMNSPVLENNTRQSRAII